MNIEALYLYDKKYNQAMENKIYYNPKGFKLFVAFIEDYSNMVYDLIHNELDPISKIDKEAESQIRKICINVEKEIYPNFIKIWNANKERIKGNDDEKEITELYIRAEDTLYSVIAFRNIKYFAFYVERNKIPKLRIWEKTMTIFENFFWYAQRMIMKEDIELIRASYFPGAGKTYAGNLICAFLFGYDYEMSILRITYSDDLAKQFTRQIVEIIATPQYRKVFPKFNKEDKDLYSVNNTGGFKFKFSTTHNFYATTTGGQSTGKRAKLLMIDDVSKGQEDAYHIDVHNQIVDKYDSNWASRTDEDKQYQIILGTMWSPYDLLNVIMEREKKRGKIYDSSKFKYTKVNAEDERNITKVFIGVPILDYKTDKSTCPLRYSTEKMRQKRDDYRDKELFEAVYQQNPIEPQGLIFGYSRLNCYEKIPFKKDCPYETKGMIDPSKVGKDFCAFGIFRRFLRDDGSWSQWYLIDAIYKQERVEDLYEVIVQKIIHHNVYHIGGELNTNSSLLYEIKKMCSERGYSVKTKEVWTYENKENKISGARTGMKTEIIYPAQSMYSPRSDIGLGMIHLTTWDISGRNAHDDFPDMVAMFVINFCIKEEENSFNVLRRSEVSLR